MFIDKNVCKWISIALFAGIAFLPLPVSPGGPVGHLDSIGSSLRSKLIHAMDTIDTRKKVYESSFSRRVKAFILDHRQSVNVYAIPDYRLSEAAICILQEKYDYTREFNTYIWNESFLDWCRDISYNRTDLP